MRVGEKSVSLFFLPYIGWKNVCLQLTDIIVLGLTKNWNHLLNRKLRLEHFPAPMLRFPKITQGAFQPTQIILCS